MMRETEQILDSPIFGEVVDSVIDGDAVGMLIRLEKLSEQFPKHPIVLLHMGIAHSLLDDDEEAFKLFRQARSACLAPAAESGRHPALGWALVESSCWLSAYYREKGRFAAAETIVRHVIEKGIRSSTLWHAVADVRRDQLDHEGALNALHEALSIRRDSTTWDRIGGCCAVLGHLGEAVRAHSQALEVGTGCPDTWGRLGWVLLRYGKVGAASLAFGHAVKKGGHDDPHFLNAYAYTLCGSRRGAEATGYAKRAVSLNPKSAPCWDTLSFAYIETGQYGLSIEAALKAIALNWDEVEAWYHLGAANARSGKTEKAREILDRLKSMDLAWAGSLANEMGCTRDTTVEEWR